MSASPPIFPVAMNYLHVGTLAQLSVVIQKWTHRHISLNFTIQQLLCCNMCKNAKLFITSAHQQPIPFCIIMKRIDNLKKKHFQILKQHIKYSTCVYVFFQNIHISPYNKLIQRKYNLSQPNFLQCTVVGQMIIMHINNL